jgi:hypothetical protein
MASVCIAVIDSGFCRIGALNSLAPLWVDFTGGASEPPVLSGPTPIDEGSHGARAAAMIAAVTDANVSFLLCRVAASGSTANMDHDVANAIRFSVRSGADVVYFGWASYEPMPQVDAAIGAASDVTLFVAPAGNSSGDIDRNPVFPAAFAHDNLLVVTHERLLSVGSRQDDVGHGRISVDAIVQGVQAIGIRLGSALALGDTSGAAAVAAGLAARAKKRNPNLSPVDLKRAVLTDAKLPDDWALASNLRSWTASGGILHLPS